MRSNHFLQNPAKTFCRPENKACSSYHGLWGPVWSAHWLPLQFHFLSTFIHPCDAPISLGILQLLWCARIFHLLLPLPGIVSPLMSARVTYYLFSSIFESCPVSISTTVVSVSYITYFMFSNVCFLSYAAFHTHKVTLSTLFIVYSSWLAPNTDLTSIWQTKKAEKKECVSDFNMCSDFSDVDMKSWFELYHYINFLLQLRRIFFHLC